MEVEYRATKYFADDDRRAGYWRHRLELNLGLDHWLPSQDRIELGLRLSHDFDRGENTGMLYVIWHDSNGRRYLDFGPGEIPFRAIRDRNAPLGRNNRIDVETEGNNGR